MELVRTHFKSFLGMLAAVLVVSALAVTTAPRFAAAEAGSGGGGSSSGCSRFTYSTCYGAVWRYYKTSSNSYPIKNVGAGYTYASGCGKYGGFFAYVLVNKNAPDDGGQVRSWKIGPVDGQSGNRSIFFGGWTNYTLRSNPSDPRPSNPSSGRYSWYAVQKAFALAQQLGQTSGYQWNGSSTLGWFCYQGIDFTLNPVITGPEQAEAGQTVTLSPSVNNTGSTTSPSVTWQVNRIKLGKDDPIPAAATTTNDPKTQYDAPGRDFTLIKSGSSTFRAGTNALADVPDTMPDYDIGTKVCYMLSVKPYNHSASTTWRHSTLLCIIASKSPKVQVLGSDLWVGKSTTADITSSSTTKKFGSKFLRFGSFGEYGVLSSGIITGFGSGAGYSEGAPTTASSSNDYCQASLLTFTSAGTTTCASTATNKGGYNFLGQLPDIASRFVASEALTSTQIDVSDAGSNLYSYSSETDTLKITASGSVGKGKSIVIVAPKASVRITDNITYTGGSLNAVNDIPQVVIIADKISIDASVGRVDAWLIATGSKNGSINTCTEISNPATQLNSDKCDKKLTINGPVVARHLYLYRTAGSGSGSASGDPAEVFNLRPDAYLWATGYTSSAGRLQTVSTKELPPRF